MTKPRTRAETRRWEIALERREKLAAEIESLSTQLETLQEMERTILRDRGGLEAVQKAREATSAGRAMLEQAQAELESLDAEIPALEKAADRADLVYDMCSAAKEGEAVKTRIYEILRGIVEREGEALAELITAHEALDGAVLRYETVGRRAVPGETYNGTSLWLANSPERKALEGEIKRSGTSLKAVSGNLEPQGKTPIDTLVWGMYAEIRGKSRAAKRLNELEEQRREDMERQRAREERRAAANASYSGY